MTLCDIMWYVCPYLSVWYFVQWSELHNCVKRSEIWFSFLSRECWVYMYITLSEVLIYYCLGGQNDFSYTKVLRKSFSIIYHPKVRWVKFFCLNFWSEHQRLGIILSKKKLCVLRFYQEEIVIHVSVVRNIIMWCWCTVSVLC